MIPNATLGRRVLALSYRLSVLLSSYVLLTVLLTGVFSAQTPEAAQVQNEDALLRALIDGEPNQAATIKTLIAEHQHLVSLRLWEKLIERAALAYYINPNKALAIYNAALEVAGSLNDKRLQALTHYKIGLMRSGTGQTQLAIESYLTSKQLFEEIGSQKDLVYILSDLGSLYFHLENFGEAKRYAEASIALADMLKSDPAVLEARQDNFGVAGALSTLGFISLRQGGLMQAIEYLQQSLALYRDLDGGSLKFGLYIADKLSALGGVYELMGDNWQALTYLNQALELARKLPYPNLRASVLNNLGMLYLEQEDYARSSEYFTQALEVYQSQRNTLEIARVSLNLGVIQQRQGNYASALEHFGKSLEQATKLGNKELVIASEEGIGAVQQAQGNYATALDALDRGLALAKETDDQVRIAEILWRKSEALYAGQRHAEATALAQTALDLARRLRLPKLSYLIATTLGRAYIGQQKPDAALGVLSQAVEQVERLRVRVAGQNQERQLFFESKVGAYHSLIGLLIAQTRPLEALLYAERAKGRALLDYLSDGGAQVARTLSAKDQREERELNQAIGDLNHQVLSARLQASSDAARLNQLESRLHAARLRYASFQDLLQVASAESNPLHGYLPTLTQSSLDDLIKDDQTAYLEYVVTKERVFLFVLTKGGSQRADLRIHTINIEEAELTQLVSDYQRMMGDRIPTFAALSRRLYELLLKPAESQLQGLRALCIIPDGPLWNAPFQAIQGRNGRYVIEDYAVHYAPSLSVLAKLAQRDIDPKRGRIPSLLALGNPLAGGQTVARLQESNRGGAFDPLPEAESEVKALAQMFDPARSKVFTGTHADEMTFKSSAADYDILHLATHGILDGRHPLYSYLLLAKPTGDTNDDGLLEAREIMRLNLRADLAVLSACETARGRIGAGEGVIGMSWAFFVAGCRTTVVSQWQVNSPSTAKLMGVFYRHLRPGVAESGKTKDKALRLAALELMKDARFRHPYYWAGFVMIGSNK